MVKLLDTTLRDGSYVIDFQFTAKDTTLIAAKLDAAGVDYIEVGHGLGLHAGTKDTMRAAVSDEAYLEASAAAVKKGKWGMFFIPGIGREEDIVLAAKYGMNFIRVGTNVNEIKQSEKYIKLAKDLGMYVFANYMKTYAVDADEVGRNAKLSASYGADLVCVVDSAGGMFPEDVERYIKAIRNNSDVAIGFHGHNNLGMAIANSLKAIELNVDVVDTSVRGMGRSAGNTVTEIFLLTLKRRGIELGIDVNKILDLAEQQIDPLLKNYNQLDSIGIVSGYAQFHSSFLGKVLSYAQKHRIDPRELIVRVTKVDKVNAPDDLIEKLSLELADEQKGVITTIDVEFPGINQEQESKPLDIRAKLVADKTVSIAKKWARTSVLNIVQGVRGNAQSVVSSAINEGHNYIVSSIEVINPAEAALIAKQIDGIIEYVLLDIDIKNSNSQAVLEEIKNNFSKTKILPYSDNEVWGKSIVQLLLEFFKQSVFQKEILVVGNTALALSIQSKLKNYGANVTLLATEKNGVANAEIKFDGIIIADAMNGEFLLDRYKMVESAVIIDGWIGSFTAKQIKEMNKNGVEVVRPNMHPFIHAEISSALATHTAVYEQLGVGYLNGVKIAAGGIVTNQGAIIVDSIKKPTKIIGVADGKGFLIPLSNYETQNIKDIGVIEKAIAFLV